MSIARVVNIYSTDFKDFTHDTLNFCWPVLEYGVAILVCSAPAWRPLFEKIRFFSFGVKLSRFWNKGSDHSSRGTSNHSGFNRLKSPSIPLGDLGAPTSIVSITGPTRGANGVRQHDDQHVHNDLYESASREAGLSLNTISVETRFDVR